MPVDEENKELRDLVAETLKTKGVLGKVQAEIRASVFLALEEQDVFKDKSPFLNKPLKEFLKTPDGLTVLSLVKEFIEFFNLEFTSMVFDPETHAGIDYTYEGRSKLANELSMDSPTDKPLLAHVLAQLKRPLNSHVNTDSNHLGIKSFKDDALIALSPEPSNLSNGINGDSAHVKDRKEKKVEPPQSHGDGAKISATRHELKDKPKTEESLTSLSNLPPLNNKHLSFSNHKGNDLKSLIDIGLNSKFDSTTTDDKQTKSSSKSESEESEIEEDIASHESNVSGVTAVSDDNTMDVSVSKASGHGDYLEEV